MVDLAKQLLDLRSGEGFGQGMPAPDKMTRLDGMTSHDLVVEAKVKKMLQRIEAAIDGRPRPAVLMLPFDKLVHLARGDLGERHGDLGKKQAQIDRVTRDGVCGELSPLQVRPKPVDGGLADVVHRLPPLESLLLFDLGHGVVVLGALGPVIQLSVAEGHLERAVPHELFDHLQRGTRIEELGGKGMPAMPSSA
jgi:hypothetical protein